jgi:hypothetical protein
VSDPRIELTIKVSIDFDPTLYEGLLGDDEDGTVTVEDAAAWEQKHYDSGNFDITDYLIDREEDKVTVTFEGVKGDAR